MITILFYTTLAIVEVLSIPSEERSCLYEAIYHESRGEELYGQYKVGKVIMNRTLHREYPTNICGVVYQKGQFEYTWKVDNKRYDDKSKLIGNLALLNHIKTKLFGDSNFVLFFTGFEYNNSNLEKVKTIGNHNFYKLKDEYKSYGRYVDSQREPYIFGKAFF